MSDESDAPAGEPAELEIHVNLRHPALVGQDGRARPATVQRLLAMIPQVVAEAVTAGLTPETGAVLDPDNGQPMAYWVFTYRGTELVPEDE